jgi:hypothetical protein
VLHRGSAHNAQFVLLNLYHQLWRLRGTLGGALAEGGNVLTCGHRRARR